MSDARMAKGQPPKAYIGEDVDKECYASQRQIPVPTFSLSLKFVRHEQSYGPRKLRNDIADTVSSHFHQTMRPQAAGGPGALGSSGGTRKSDISAQGFRKDEGDKSQIYRCDDDSQGEKCGRCRTRADVQRDSIQLSNNVGTKA